MTRLLPPAVLMAGLLCGCMPQPIHANETPSQTLSSAWRIVVALRNGADLPSDMFLRNAQQATGSQQVQYATPASGKIRVLLIHAASGQTLADTLTRLRGLPEVEFAEPDEMSKAH